MEWIDKYDGHKIMQRTGSGPDRRGQTGAIKQTLPDKHDEIDI